MPNYFYIILPFIGAIGGFLAGMLGVGGGIIFIPVINYITSMLQVNSVDSTKYALANSIFLVFISGISGIIKQYKNGELQIRTALIIGLAGTIVSTLITYLIQFGDWYNKENFQIVFLCFLILAIANMLFGKKEIIDNADKIPFNSNLKKISVGAIAGMVVSLSGLGGGVVMVPLFKIWMRLKMKVATLLSLSIIPIISLIPLLSYLFVKNTQKISSYQSGYILWDVALPMALGIFICAPLGIKTAKKIPVQTLRLIFAILASFIFVKTIIEIIK